MAVVDDHIATLPERFEAPIHPDVLAPRPEARWPKLRRALARSRQRLVATRREVPLRQLARYHFSGELPGRLEGLAALLVNAELHLADQVNALFPLAAQGLEEAAILAESEGTEAANARLEALRQALDDDFDLALGDLESIARDGSRRVTSALGRAMKRLRVDVRTIGTLDLPPRHRRYSRVFAERNEALTRLGPGLKSARGVVAGRLSQLALELELVGLEGRSHDVVHQHADRLTRSLRGRGATQLRRIEGALGAWIAATEVLLLDPPSAGALAAKIRTSSEPVVFQITEAHGVASQLVDQLADDAWVNSLIDALRQAARDLTDHYEIPTSPCVTGDWNLPAPAPTTELPFHDLVTGFIEIQVTRDLLDLSVGLSAQAADIAAALAELERVTAFNVELAGTELDLLDHDAVVGQEAKQLVHAMVIGAVGRSHARLAELIATAEAQVAVAEEQIRSVVIGELTDLRDQILGGRLADLRSLWLQEGPIGRQIRRRAQRWRGLLPQARARLGRLARRALGEDRMLALRAILGLPELGDERDLRSALAQPTPVVQVPLVYRRLFSEAALEAGDLLSGRQSELDRIRAALAPGGSATNRAVAVVSLDAQESLALVTAATRASATVRWAPTGPVSADEVDAWFDALPEGRTAVLAELKWLFVRHPRGFESLDRLVHRLVDAGGRNGFVIIADRSVWQHCSRVSGLSEAMGTVIHLAPLDVDQLEAALLSRHAMSGYDVEFHAEEDLGWQLQHVLRRGEDRDRRRQRAWFGTLHDASAGVLQDALRLWMAAITRVDTQGQIHIGAVPRPPLTRLAELPEEDLLTLLEVTRQGWIDPEGHRQLFRTELGWSKAHLAQLHHVGLLVPDHHGFRLAPHLRGPLHRILAWRGWT